MLRGHDNSDSEQYLQGDADMSTYSHLNANTDTNIDATDSSIMTAFHRILTRITDNSQRKLDDVDYWRKRAGWYDDDVSMSEYNQGVINGYGYNTDDDYQPSSSSGSSSSSSKSSGSSMFNFAMNDIMTTAVQIFGALFALVIIIMIIRAMGRKR
eukprot:72534_1